MTGCPSEDELVGMVEGALDEAALAGIEAHVDSCEHCAEVIAGLGALGHGPGPHGSGSAALGSAGSGPGALGSAGSDRGDRGAGSGPRGSAGAGADSGDRGSGSGGRGGPAPRTVGRYRLDRRIAAGGMGEVWAAWDPHLRRELAVKLVRPERARDGDGRERERLLREARALARLGHPNVLAVYDVGEIDGEVFIATELVAGETLASRGGPSASWRELTRLYAQAARGLAAAHAAGLVHRDVKPANLLLGLDGRVRVADFGLAVPSAAPSASARTELPTDQVSITATGFVAGTPAYMAPEQRAGEPTDARADQYALCVSLVEAIDGRRPLLDMDRGELIAFIGQRRAREPDLDALCGVLARGLAMDPRKRYPDAGALADALERLAAGGSRELESAATVSAIEPSSTPGAGPYGDPGSGSGPRSAPGRARGSASSERRARGADDSSERRARGADDSNERRARGADDSNEPWPDSAGSGGPRARAASSQPPELAGADGSSPSRPPGAGRSPSSRPPGAGRSPSSRPPGAGGSSPNRIPGTGGSSPNRIPGTGGSSASGSRASAQTRADKPSAKQRDAPRRRLPPVAIAGLAAAAGVVAVLVGARALSRKPARPADAGSADAAGQAPRVEPIGPGSGAALGSGSALAPTASGGSGAVPAPAALDGSGAVPAPAPFRGTGAPPPGPGGVPLDLPPRATASKTVAVAPSAAPSAGVTTFAADIQKALQQRDTRACKQLVAGLPADIHQSMRFAVETLAAYCEMMAGNCAGGSARLDRAQVAQGLAAQGTMLADQFCPVEGPLETRVARLRAQIGAYATGAAIAPAWCDALLLPAKKAAAEATSGPHRAILGWGLQQLARCIGGTGRCDDARALWSTASTLDESIKLQKPDLGPKCAAASAQLAATEAYTDPTALLQSLDAAIRGRDLRACQKLLATPVPNVHPGQRYSIEMQLGHCEMMTGSCAAGTARLQRLGPNPSGPAVDPSIAAAWLASHAGTYCPITGDVDARVARLWSQVDGFTSRGGGGNLAWCDALVGTARTLAGEVATPQQRKRAGMALQRLAGCVAAAGRCEQGRELWTLSTQVDPNALATPVIGAKCP